MSNPVAKKAPVPILLRSRVETMVDAGFPLSRISTESGIRRRDLEFWLEGREMNGADERIAAWFAELAAEEELAPPGFVKTPTSGRIHTALETARFERSIALIYGSAGVGKSQAARYYLEQHHRPQFDSLPAPGGSAAVMIQASPANNTVMGTLESLAEAVGSYANAHTKQALQKGILRSIEYKGIRLLIVDEAQYLEADALDALRFLNDDGRGLGIAYLGNAEVYTRIHGKSRAARFAHLSSRISMRVKLDCPTEGDVDAILQAWGVSGRKEREYCIANVQLAKGLRELCTILDKSRALARDMGCAVDVRIIRSTAKALGIWQG